MRAKKKKLSKGQRVIGLGEPSMSGKDLEGGDFEQRPKGAEGVNWIYSCIQKLFVEHLLHASIVLAGDKRNQHPDVMS